MKQIATEVKTGVVSPIHIIFTFHKLKMLNYINIADETVINSPKGSSSTSASMVYVTNVSVNKMSSFYLDIYGGFWSWYL